LNANPYAYLDDAPLEERRARAVEMRRVLPDALLTEVARLDPAAIAEVRAEAWPDVRDADEMHDVLETLIALPEGHAAMVSERLPAAPGVLVMPSLAETTRGEGPDKPSQRWAQHLQELASQGRATRAQAGGRAYWAAAEKAKSFQIIFPAAEFEKPLPDVEPLSPSREDAFRMLANGWMAHIGPTTARSLAETLGIAEEDSEHALLRLEAAGTVLRGHFTNASPDVTEWCDRRLLARIHRLTLGRLRSEVQPVSAAQFMRWLLRWQHVAEGTQTLGERGTLEVLRQLQGFEAPATAWERHILSRRVANYDPKILDQLCLMGAVGWGRLSPHPATLEDDPDTHHRVIPTSVAPVAFFVREDADWMIPQHPGSDHEDPRGLSANGRDVMKFLRLRGASFFADIVRGTGKLKAEAETALWELVAAGMITADVFDNMRALIDPRRRAGHGSGRTARPRHSAGRWSLLYANEAVDRARTLESVCWMLLRRYGVVFRELLARESILPKWREILITLRRLEDRGEIRGGRFVNGFLGEQFALPVAVESLRAARKQAPSRERITISGADPLNLVGSIVPGDRVPAVSGKTVTFVDGVAADREDAARPAESYAAGG
jgi:ATP-dependent Lhr-like helicase